MNRTTIQSTVIIASYVTIGLLLIDITGDNLIGLVALTPILYFVVYTYQNKWGIKPIELAQFAWLSVLLAVFVIIVTIILLTL